MTEATPESLHEGPQSERTVQPHPVSLPDITLQRDAPQAVHAQIAEWLGELIESGSLPVGARLPNERSLSERLRVSRMTLRQALHALESRGLIHRVTGRKGGAFVSAPPISVDLTGLPGLALQIRASEQLPSSIVRLAQRRSADRRAAAALELQEGAEVWFLERVRLADGQPVALERSSFPVSAFPDLLDHDLEGSIYAVLGAFDHAPASAEEQLEPVLALDEEASALQVRTGRPLLLRIRTTRSADGTPVEYSRDLFRTDRARVIVSSRV